MELLRLQRELQEGAYGVFPHDLSGEELVEYLRMNVLACTDELHEALREIPGWKPWSASEPPGTLVDTVEGEMFAEELIDALHFLANCVNCTGISDERFEELYRRKRDENFRRRAEGYAG